MLSAFLVTVDPDSTSGAVGLGNGHSFAERRRSPIAVHEAKSLIASFAALPPGGGDLCFDPVFVVEIRDDNAVHWTGGACFDCGTYSSTDGQGPPGGTFDQFSPEAIQLLDRLRSLA